MANETLTEAFSDIADAIRAKGVTGTMTPLQMPTKIESIPTGSGTLYGISGNSIVREVDANGILNGPNVPFVFGSEDIKTIAQDALKYRFYQNDALREVNLPNLTTVQSGGCN